MKILSDPILAPPSTALRVEDGTHARTRLEEGFVAWGPSSAGLIFHAMTETHMPDQAWGVAAKELSSGGQGQCAYRDEHPWKDHQ